MKFHEVELCFRDVDMQILVDGLERRPFKSLPNWHANNRPHVDNRPSLYSEGPPYDTVQVGIVGGLKRNLPEAVLYVGARRNNRREGARYSLAMRHDIEHYIFSDSVTFFLASAS